MSRYRLSQQLRKNGIWERLEPVLVEAGITDYEVLYTGKHPCVQFSINQKTIRYHFALTPGSCNSWKGAVTGLRRKIREMTDA